MQYIVVVRAGAGMNPWETQLRKGVVELAVLASIARRESYGYQIVEQLRGLEGLALTESTVYPALSHSAFSAVDSLCVRSFGSVWSSVQKSNVGRSRPRISYGQAFLRGPLRNAWLFQ
jgi:hypothetical protein